MQIDEKANGINDRGLLLPQDTYIVIYLRFSLEILVNPCVLSNNQNEWNGNLESVYHSPVRYFHPIHLARSLPPISVF